MAVRVREALGPLFEDEAFAGAFAVRGRPAVSPGALALVSVLQYAEGLTDRQAADQVRARIDWKFLLGLELDDPGFEASVLSLFRSRLIEHGLEQATLELVLERLRGLGLLKAGGRQRTDSTHVLAAVRTLNRMELVGETLRAALEALAVAAPAWLSGLVTAEWAERYAPRVDDYRFPKGEEVREQWSEQVGRDGFVLLEGKDLPPVHHRLCSPYGTDAGYGIKRGSGWTGYKAHLTETCEPDAPHVITQVASTNAVVADTEMTEPVHPDPRGSGLLPRRLHHRLGQRERHLSRRAPKFRVVGTETPPQWHSGPQGVFLRRALPPLAEADVVHQAPLRPLGQGHHLPAPRTARGPRSRPPGPGERQLKEPLRDPGRGRRHDLPGRACHRPTPHPLPRSTRDPPRSRLRRHCDQPHPHRPMADRHPTRRHPHLPPRSSDARGLTTRITHSSAES